MKGITSQQGTKQRPQATTLPSIDQADKKLSPVFCFTSTVERLVMHPAPNPAANLANNTPQIVGIKIQALAIAAIDKQKIKTCLSETRLLRHNTKIRLIINMPKINAGTSNCASSRGAK